MKCEIEDESERVREQERERGEQFRRNSPNTTKLLHKYVESTCIYSVCGPKFPNERLRYFAIVVSFYGSFSPPTLSPTFLLSTFLSIRYIDRNLLHTRSYFTQTMLPLTQSEVPSNETNNNKRKVEKKKNLRIERIESNKIATANVFGVPLVSLSSLLLLYSFSYTNYVLACKRVSGSVMETVSKDHTVNVCKNDPFFSLSLSLNDSRSLSYSVSLPPPFVCVLFGNKTKSTVKYPTFSTTL